MIYEYRLSFNSPVHFGLEGIGQERTDDRIRSDTLWGAIIQKWLLLYQDDPEKLCLNTPFAVSSCFPLINNMPFFPLPLGAIDHLISEAGKKESNDVSVKNLKKIRFVGEPLFREIIQGARLPVEMLGSGTVFPFPEISEKKSKEVKPAHIVMQRPRLKTDQLAGEAGEGAFFYCSDQYFYGNCGLFFLADFRDDESKNRFEAALRLLGDTGLGADRSVGRGMFCFSAIECHFPEIPNPDGYLLLSLCHPTKNEIKQGLLEAPGTGYSLVRRSGQAASHAVSGFRRYDLWMLEEGSVLKRKPAGDVVCVLEKSELVSHNVYRYGRAFALSIQSPK
jgi:CRISPR-associated protein Csm4